MPGIIPTRQQHRDTGEVVQWFQRRPVTPVSGPPAPPRHQRQTIVAVLLDPITDTMSTARARVLVPERADNVVQEVTLLGDVVENSGFKLSYDGFGETDVIYPVDPITEADEQPGGPLSIQRQLRTLLGAQSVVVSGTVGRWFVRFTAGFNLPSGDTAIKLLELVGTIFGNGLQGHVIAQTRWEATGDIETVRPLLPIRTDCPISAGNQVVCHFLHGFGYGIGDVEWREMFLDDPNSPPEY